MDSQYKNPAYIAGRALSDLNLFYAIIKLCEGSLFSSNCHKAEAKIVALCKTEAAKCLDRYDAAMARATHPRDRKQGAK